MAFSVAGLFFPLRLPIVRILSMYASANSLSVTSFCVVVASLVGGGSGAGAGALTGDRARTRVPVACHVTMQIGDERRLVHTGIFYDDRLERRPEGWRIVHRVEELAWSA